MSTSPRQLPEISTAAWYEDRRVNLTIPSNWEVRLHNPQVPAPLDDAAVGRAFSEPVGTPLHELARGRMRPLIVVDDLTRPTPVDRVLPFVLDELEQAGIQAKDVTIMVATGTHGPASREEALRKVGPLGAMCRLLGHDDMGPSIRLGRTSFGSYVYVNPAVASCDLLVGIGGIYPQNTAAFGGGAKLVLGVLGRRSIEDLHFGHPSDDGRYEIDNEFRRDVAEMARMAGLAFSVSAMVDQHRRLIWIKAGNHELYYASAVAEAIEMFGCAKPRDADVVIANAYPMDVSATFMRSKGIIPLLHAKPGASRILIAGCSEGIGHHGLFPLKPRTGLAADVMTLRRHLRYSPGAIPKLIFDRALRTAGPRRRHADAASAERRRDVICFVTSSTAGLVGGDIPGMRVFSDWERVVDAVEEEQGASDEIAVSLYPCSPLQVFSRAS